MLLAAHGWRAPLWLLLLPSLLLLAEGGEGEPEIVLWDGRRHSGRSIRLACCGETQLGPLLKAAGIRRVRSISVPRGVHAAFRTSSSSLLSADSKARSFSTSSDLGNLDGIVASYPERCCSSVQLTQGVLQHSEETSVFLYEEEGFQGASVAYAEGDHGKPPLQRVASVRVPGGFRVSFRMGDRPESDPWSEAPVVLNRDSRSFPTEDTANATGSRKQQLPVQGLSVRRRQPEDLHGLWLYFEPAFHGRPQFLDAGGQYKYPESWPALRSLRPTNWTHGRLFAAEDMLLTEDGVEDVRANFSRPQTVEVGARCEPEDFCGAHGRCVQPQGCDCDLEFTGQRCHLQNPDETSAIICERNAVVVGEVVPCRLMPRRDNLACNATSVLLSVEFGEELQGGGELFGSPLIKGRFGLAMPGQDNQEADAFRFEAVFSRPGNFTEPFVIGLIRRPAEGAFVPHLEVLERCDVPDVRTDVRCDSGGACSLALLRGQSSKPLRCPVGAVRLSLLARPGRAEAVALRGEAPGPAAERFLFELPGPWPVHSNGRPVHLRVEVQHGLEAEAVHITAVSVGPEPAEAGTAAVALAGTRALLQSGDAAGALRLLDACASLQPCLSLRADLLLRLGRFEEAGELLGSLVTLGGGNLRARLEAASGAVVAATEALGRGEHAAALPHLQTAVEAAPLSTNLRVLRAQAFLAIGDFAAAAEEARRAHRLGPTTAPEGAEVLKLLGHALLGQGLADIARQNFLGCAVLHAGAGCELLVSAAKELEVEARALAEAVEAESWEPAVERAERLLRDQESRWPAFSLGFWSLRAHAALCTARAAMGASGQEESWEGALEPCAAVATAAVAMRAQLQSHELLGCQVAFAEALEHNGSIAEALSQAEAAEALLASLSQQDSLPEALIAEARLLRERLSRALRRRPKAKREGRVAASHYEVLGVPQTATLPQIKSAYRRLALKYHPDKNPDPEAVQIFLDIQQAYQVLSDETLRARYDAGQHVDEEAGAKNMRPMQFKVVGIDRLRGVKLVRWYDPNTGEEGYIEMELPKTEQPEAKQRGERTLRAHCCLPGPATTAEQPEGKSR